MFNFSKIFFILIMIMVSFSQTAFADDPLLLSNADMQKLKKYFPNDSTTENHRAWNGDPLEIALPLNKEKRLVFPVHVTVDVKGALTTDQLKITNDDKSLYLTALKPFSKTRIYITLAPTNEVVLLDVMTDDSASSETEAIDIHQNNANTVSQVPQSMSSSMISNNDNSDNLPSGTDAYITLVRFAWQQLYAPKRLLNNPYAIARAPMHTLPFLSTLVYGDKVYAHPAISWQYGGHYVTAVELRNKYQHPTRINIARDLCGNWEAATLYPRSDLASAGNKPKDSTTLFVISNQPFGNSMEACNGHAQ